MEQEIGPESSGDWKKITTLHPLEHIYVESFSEGKLFCSLLPTPIARPSFDGDFAGKTINSIRIISDGIKIIFADGSMAKISISVARTPIYGVIRDDGYTEHLWTPRASGGKFVWENKEPIFPGKHEELILYKYRKDDDFRVSTVDEAIIEIRRLKAQIKEMGNMW